MLVTIKVHSVSRDKQPSEDVQELGFLGMLNSALKTLGLPFTNCFSKKHPNKRQGNLHPFEFALHLCSKFPVVIAPPYTWMDAAKTPAGSRLWLPPSSTWVDAV